MNVSDIMSAPAAKCRAGSTLAAAGLEMLRQDCGILAVVEDGRGLTGVITDRDICMAVSTRRMRADEIPVRSVMATTLHTVSPDDDLAHVLTVMVHGRVRRIPVVDGEWRLHGMISISDIILIGNDPVRRGEAPPCDQILAALRSMYGHWRPHRLGELAAATRS
jgi:CBS domain-containing protein